MKNITYKSITVFLLFIIFIILNTGNVKAVLQANGNTSATYNLSDWMLNVRKMEELGGAMGLSETLNSDLTSTSDSNNIDVHMEKNTEYGALAILSASSYGNPNVIADGDTTTGNATGVVMNINKEWVAASLATVGATNFKKATLRYKNVYTETYISKNGDAISETQGWHGSTSSTWLMDTYGSSKDACALLRGYAGSIFSYYGYGRTSSPFVAYKDAYWANTYASRAVVVSGERFLKKRKGNEYNNERNKKLY